MKDHYYQTKLTWTGNLGAGTSHYTSYSRDFIILADGKPTIMGSSDPAFRGDSTRYNPEEMLLAAIASCHMLWYLHLCSANGIVVTRYEDNAKGIMSEEKNGAGQFKEVVLRPLIKISQGEVSLARGLHTQAHEFCFIARSLNFPVFFEPTVEFFD
jgi:organic hydroperoxide reductase OsmC/OhrA